MLDEREVEAQISYAYIHAVASQAGVGCEVTGRTLDIAGVDLELHVTHHFDPPAVLTDFSVHVQAKATITRPPVQDGKISYFLDGIDRYNALRSEAIMPPRLLVVLFLPSDRSRWVEHSVEELLLRDCAYWVSLRGAAESVNRSGQTIYIPDTQIFSPDGLVSLLRRIACQEELRYE